MYVIILITNTFFFIHFYFCFPYKMPKKKVKQIIICVSNKERKKHNFLHFSFYSLVQMLQQFNSKWVLSELAIFITKMYFFSQHLCACKKCAARKWNWCLIFVLLSLSSYFLILYPAYKKSANKFVFNEKNSEFPGRVHKVGNETNKSKGKSFNFISSYFYNFLI